MKLDRPLGAYILWGDGPHQCIGKQINMIQVMCLLKIVGQLKNFRRTPGDEGRLKALPKAGGVKLYMTADWSDYGPYPFSISPPPFS